MDAESPPDRFESKTAARAWVRAVLRQSPQVDYASISRDSSLNVIDLLEKRVHDHRPRVMIYSPFRHEIDPIMVGSYAISKAGEVCLGTARDRSSPLCPILIDPEALRDGRWTIPDPVEDAWGTLIPRSHTPVDPATLDAVVVPGMAFDRQGGRLGRGAGVYDRFLARLPERTLRIGLIPSALLVERLPTEPHDIPMHAVATERGVLQIA